MDTLKTLVFAAFIIGSFISYPLAQSGNSSLILVVSDPLGNVVTGATVTLTDSQKVKTIASTDEGGQVEFRRLAIGQFQIAIEIQGFKEYHDQSLTIKTNETKILEIVLNLADIESTVDVDQNDFADLNNSSTTRDLGKEEIETLPDNPDDLRRVLQTIAGPTITGEDMPLTVDGIPGAALPPKENIKLVRVNRNVFSAQYEETFGGGIEIFTNSDAKKLSGWMRFSLGDSRFNAKDPYLQRRIPSQSRHIAFGLNGPFGKKTSFGFFAQRSLNNTGSLVNAIVLDQTLNAVEFRESYRTSRISQFANASITSDPNKKHKIYVNYNLWSNSGRFSDIGGFALASRANRTSFSEHSLGVSDTYIINPDFVNVMRFSARISDNGSTGAIDEPAINVTDAFLGGGSQVNRSSATSRVEFYNDTTRKVGKYSVGFGFSLRFHKISETSRSNFGGTYTFSGRLAPLLDGNNQPVRDPSGNLVIQRISSIESYRRTLLFTQLGYSKEEIRALGGGAD